MTQHHELEQPFITFVPFSFFLRANEVTVVREENEDQEEVW